MFRRFLVGIWCAAFIAGLTPALTAANADNSDLQGQVTELRQQLEALEAQLKATSDQQKKAATGEKIEFSGYIQSRFADMQDTPSTFTISRARLKMKGQVTERDAFTFPIDARSKDGKVQLRDAYLDHTVGSRPGSYIRMGQTKIPIMYDVLTSSSVRLAPERTVVALSLFPGERDTGLLYHFAPDPQKPGVWVGLVNGQGRNSNDLNNEKTPLARVLFPAGNGSAYVGYYHGNVVGVTTTDKKVAALGTEQRVGNVRFWAEYAIGENLSLDVAGWYAQVAVALKKDVATFFVRYDTYNEDRDVIGATFKRTTVGLEHRLSNKSRLTLALELKDPDAGSQNLAGASGANDKNVLTAQYQVKY